MASPALAYNTIAAKPASTPAPLSIPTNNAAVPPQTLDHYGSGDTYLVPQLLEPEISAVSFERVKEEVEWHTMYHRGGEVPRLVAVQGVISPDGSIPLYRHPSDESPPLQSVTPTVALIANRVQRVLGHPVNHVLIQHYRTGHDHISEHADKTIDIMPASNIVNVSLGATRTMVLRHKDDDSQSDAFLQTIPLPHNSMFVLGLETNREWKHGIHPVRGRRAVVGERISLTFRYIGTFLTKDMSMIYGQGAVGKTRAEARPVVNGGQMVRRLIGAFGEENRDSQFDWEKVYGGGFDVLHFGNLQR